MYLLYKFVFNIIYLHYNGIANSIFMRTVLYDFTNNLHVHNFYNGVINHLYNEHIY